MHSSHARNGTAFMTSTIPLSTRAVRVLAGAARWWHVPVSRGRRHGRKAPAAAAAQDLGRHARSRRPGAIRHEGERGIGGSGCRRRECGTDRLRMQLLDSTGAPRRGCRLMLENGIVVRADVDSAGITTIGDLGVGQPGGVGGRRPRAVAAGIAAQVPVGGGLALPQLQRRLRSPAGLRGGQPCGPLPGAPALLPAVEYVEGCS